MRVWQEGQHIVFRLCLCHLDSAKVSRRMVDRIFGGGEGGGTMMINDHNSRAHLGAKKEEEKEGGDGMNDSCVDHGRS